MLQKKGVMSPEGISVAQEIERSKHAKLYAHLLVRTTMNCKFDFAHATSTKRLAKRVLSQHAV